MQALLSGISNALILVDSETTMTLIRVVGEELDRRVIYPWEVRWIIQDSPIQTFDDIDEETAIQKLRTARVAAIGLPLVLMLLDQDTSSMVVELALVDLESLLKKTSVGEQLAPIFKAKPPEGILSTRTALRRCQGHFYVTEFFSSIREAP